MDDATTIATIPKNRKDTLVFRLSKYEGHDLADVRVFYSAEDGELRPTGKGISFATRLLPDVISALQEVEREARTRGLIE